jgi:hypothetical protein
VVVTTALKPRAMRPSLPGRNLSLLVGRRRDAIYWFPLVFYFCSTFAPRNSGKILWPPVGESDRKP